MNSWLDKRVYNEARYGSAGFGTATKQDVKQQRSSKIKIFGGSGLFKLRTPTAVAAVLSMLYGGYSAALTRADYLEVAHQAFKSGFVVVAQLWSQIAGAVGISNNGFVTSVVEFVAVMVSLFFALFAGLGGAIVAAFQALFHG
jgi:hypothetical protein